MARLNEPPDSPYATTANNRTSSAVAASQPNMPSPQLRSLSLETSSQSQGSDNLPHSPPCQGSEQPSLSPADCRTLEKILRNVASPPATSSALERNDQLSLDSDCASTASPPAKKDCYNLVGGEATDTGYEDEDDSMEISEGEAVVMAQSTVTSLDGHASPSISKSDRRLQDSVSAHDQKDKLRYSGGRRSLTTKRAKAKRTDHERAPSLEVIEVDSIEDILNIPGKRVVPARPLIFNRSDFDRHTVSDDIEQLNRMRLSMEKMLDQGERVEFGAEPDVSISSLPGLQYQAEDFEESELDGFDADVEETQSKISSGRKISQGNASIERQSLLIATVEKAGDSAILVPSTPARTPEPARFQVTTNQSVPETPFTKTLSYFKQYKGAENSLAKRRRNTALPEELAEVTEDVADTEVKIDDPKEHNTQPEDGDACMLKATSALMDLEFMAQPDDNIDGAIAAPPLHQEDRKPQISAVIDGASEQIRAISDSEAVDANKQMILYPQHPAFVNAIGMIPATMFWVTAAPIVKYTSIAVEILIDKLRDTYL